MFTAQIALVSQSKSVGNAALMKVSAALQKQAERDFAPYWNIRAAVDSFASLKDVPPGRWPIIVMDKIPYNAEGIHLNTKNGQPFALVNAGPAWTLTASHEMLEMLADPYGNRLVAGESLKAGQGRVEYLVEVCDPSEAPDFSYSVDGVQVSDFYMRSFFDPVPAPGARYSFTGSITAPRQVLDGGYISWHVPTTNELWQLFVVNGQPQFVNHGSLAKLRAGGRSLRVISDRQAAEFRKGNVKAEASDGASASIFARSAVADQVNKAAEAAAGDLQDQIDKLAATKAGQTQEE